MNYSEVKKAIEDPTYEYRAIDVISPLNEKNKLARKVIYQQNLDEFLRDLQNKGNYQSLKIVMYKKNGSTWDRPESIVVDMRLPETPQHNTQHAQHPHQQRQPFFNGGMNMPFGMNDPMADNLVKIKLFDKVEQERDKLKEKLLECEKQRDKFERKLELEEIKKENRSFWESPAFDKVADGLEKFVISANADADKIVSGNNGMNAPDNPALANFCKQIEHFDDGNIQYLQTLINLLNTNEEFNDSLTQLINNHTKS